MRVINSLVLLFTVFLWCSGFLAYASIINQTIDDTFGDSLTGQKVLFLPTTPGVWKSQNCSDCAILPDIGQTFKGTYTAATYNQGLGSMNFTLNFHGTAIYVFFILANNAGPGITTLTAANFTLDNQPPELKLHAPDVTSTNIQYNSLIYSQTGLPAGPHTLLVSTSGVDNAVYINFDYAIYTHDDAVVAPLPSTSPSASLSASVPLPSVASTTSSSASSTHSSTIPPPVISNHTPGITSSSSGSTPSSKTLEDNGTTTKVNGGAVAGGVIGVLLAVALIVAIFFLMCKRQKRLDAEQLIFRRVEIDPAPSMSELENGAGHNSQHTSESGHSASSINPYQYNAVEVAHTRLTLQVPVSRPPPMSQIPVTPSEAGDPYGGYITPMSAATSRYSAMAYPSFGRQMDEGRPQLQVVNGRASISASTVPTLASARVHEHADHHHEDVRRARQEELRHQLAEMQQEMLELSSGLENCPADGNGAQCSTKRISIKSLRHLRAATPAGVGSSSSSITAVAGPAGDGEAEIDVEELKELIRSLRLQIEYLQMQQQSAWAQGLSDEPPPGYTPMLSRRLSVSTTATGKR